MSPDGPFTHARLRIPPWVTWCFALLAAAGMVAFLIGINGADPLRTWQAYLVNFLFWTCLAFGQTCLLAVLNITGAKWGRSLKRLSEAFGAFLPVGFLLFWVLYFGKEHLFPWIRHPLPEKQAWLNVPFLFVRDGAGILLLCLVSVVMIYFSVRGDSRKSEESNQNTETERTKSDWAKNWRMQKRLSPVVVIVYAFVMTLIGFDLVMSLDPHWYSALFGGYFFVGSFYTGIAALYLVAVVAARSEAFRTRLHTRHFHDLGKLAFAFCLFTGYLFYTQFLVIWYGNVPEETRYVILRVKLTPWEPLAWVVLFMTFIAPFVVLLQRRVKLHRPAVTVVSLVILVGMWLEKLILVAPSLWKQGTIPLGVPEALVTAGFLGVFGLSFSAFLSRVPALPLSDPLFRESIDRPDLRLAP
jgi:hypothetical protein